MQEINTEQELGVETDQEIPELDMQDRSSSEPQRGEDTPLIEAKELTKTFNGNTAVDSVSFSLQPGTIFGFVGPSGSGKTTTIRLLTGIYHPTSGEARIFQHRPSEFTRRDRERIGYMPQHFALYPELSVWQNMNFAASIYGVTLLRSERLMELLDFVELDKDRGKIARNISGGMQRRLSLASTLIHDPDLIFLDEPTAGVDPVLRSKFWEYFKGLQAEGATLFVTTQYVSEASFCDLVGVMVDSKLLVVDTPNGLRRHAIGGEIVDLRTVERLDYNQYMKLQELPFVKDLDRKDENEVRIVVEKASTAMARLVEWCKDNEVEVDSIHEYFLPFDEVFVTLIRRYRDDQ